MACKLAIANGKEQSATPFHRQIIDIKRFGYYACLLRNGRDRDLFVHAMLDLKLVLFVIATLTSRVTHHKILPVN